MHLQPTSTSYFPSYPGTFTLSETEEIHQKNSSVGAKTYRPSKRAVLSNMARSNRFGVDRSVREGGSGGPGKYDAAPLTSVSRMPP